MKTSSNHSQFADTLQRARQIRNGELIPTKAPPILGGGELAMYEYLVKELKFNPECTEVVDYAFGLHKLYRSHIEKAEQAGTTATTRSKFVQSVITYLTEKLGTQDVSYCLAQLARFAYDRTINSEVFGAKKESLQAYLQKEKSYRTTEQKSNDS